MPEFVDANGDIWAVRQCDADDECLVLEYRMTRDNGEIIDEEPDELHLPHNAVGKMILALRHFHTTQGTG